MYTAYSYNPDSTVSVSETLTVFGGKVTLRHIPKKNSVVINGFTATKARLPGVNQFYCDWHDEESAYRDANRQIIFNPIREKQAFKIDYVAVGTVWTAAVWNEIKAHLDSPHPKNFSRFLGVGDLFPFFARFGDFFFYQSAARAGFYVFSRDLEEFGHEPFDFTDSGGNFIGDDHELPFGAWLPCDNSLPRYVMKYSVIPDQPEPVQPFYNFPPSEFASARNLLAVPANALDNDFKLWYWNGELIQHSTYHTLNPDCRQLFPVVDSNLCARLISPTSPLTDGELLLYFDDDIKFFVLPENLRGRVFCSYTEALTPEPVGHFFQPDTAPDSYDYLFNRAWLVGGLWLSRTLEHIDPPDLSDFNTVPWSYVSYFTSYPSDQHGYIVLPLAFEDRTFEVRSSEGELLLSVESGQSAETAVYGFGDGGEYWDWTWTTQKPADDRYDAIGYMTFDRGDGEDFFPNVSFDYEFFCALMGYKGGKEAPTVTIRWLEVG